jgi:prefoldin subunit 5
MLQGQIESMENALSELKQRMSELEAERQQDTAG